MADWEMEVLANKLVPILGPEGAARVIAAKVQAAAFEKKADEFISAFRMKSFA